VLEEINDYKIENSRLKSRIDSLTHELQSIESRFIKLQSEYENINSSSTDMNKEIITLKSNYEDQIWKHNEECRKFKSQVEGLKVDFDRSNYEKNEKSAKLEEAEQKY